MSANNSYTVQVYTNLKDASDPTSGTPAYSTPVFCSQPMAGVMTFQIPGGPAQPEQPVFYCGDKCRKHI